MSEHTPLPWEVVRHNHAAGDLWISIGHKGDNGLTRGPIAEIVSRPDFYTPVAELKYLSTSDDEQVSNAAFIVQAVNAHDALVAALMFTLENEQMHRQTLNVIRDSLALARANS